MAGEHTGIFFIASVIHFSRIFKSAHAALRSVFARISQQPVGAVLFAYPLILSLTGQRNQ